MNTNKSKTNKNILFTCILTLVIILFCGIVYATQGDNLAMIFGKQQAEILANAGDSIVATIDGEKITKKGFDSYKLFVNSGETKLSDSQILDKILERKVIYDEAVKDGIVATDEEIANAIKTAQSVISESNDQYISFKDYISGLNMTEDQYWESVKPAYKKFVTCGKFKNALKVKYSNDNKIADKTELNNKFRDFYYQYVGDLKSKAKVESEIK